MTTVKSELWHEQSTGLYFSSQEILNKYMKDNKIPLPYIYKSVAVKYIKAEYSYELEDGQLLTKIGRGVHELQDQ